MVSGFMFQLLLCQRLWMHAYNVYFSIKVHQFVGDDMTSITIFNGELLLLICMETVEISHGISLFEGWRNSFIKIFTWTRLPHHFSLDEEDYWENMHREKDWLNEKPFDSDLRLDLYHKERKTEIKQIPFSLTLESKFSTQSWSKCSNFKLLLHVYAWEFRDFVRRFWWQSSAL